MNSLSWWDMGIVTVVKFSPDGRYLAWFETGPDNASGQGERRNGIRIWDFEQDRELHLSYSLFDHIQFQRLVQAPRIAIRP